MSTNVVHSVVDTLNSKTFLHERKATLILYFTFNHCCKEMDLKIVLKVGKTIIHRGRKNIGDSHNFIIPCALPNEGLNQVFNPFPKDSSVSFRFQFESILYVLQIFCILGEILLSLIMQCSIFKQSIQIPNVEQGIFSFVVLTWNSWRVIIKPSSDYIIIKTKIRILLWMILDILILIICSYFSPVPLTSIILLANTTSSINPLCWWHIQSDVRVGHLSDGELSAIARRNSLAVEILVDYSLESIVKLPYYL